MEERVYGDVNSEGLEVVRRSGRYFVRYDAGAHQTAWREDELSAEEFERLSRSQADEYEVIISLQRRLGLDAYTSNWSPPAGNEP
jgi:hypothetical protein